MSGALLELEANKEKVINKVKLRKLQRYLKARLTDITNYEMRLRMSSDTRVEKFNDGSVSRRCKGQGRRWITAIAALVTAQRNDELRVWQRAGKLPAWG